MATKEVKTKAPAKAETKAVTVKPKSNAGRKTIMSDDLVKNILALIEIGSPVKDVVKSQGISEPTYYHWLKRGADEMERLERNSNAKPNPSEVEFLEFFKSVERAKSVAVNKHVAVVSNAGKNGDWRASAWWLERQRPEEFGKDAPTIIESQTNNNLNLVVTIGELEKLVAEVMEMRAIENER